MSLCSACGLDLDTGKRELVEHVFEDDIPPPPQPAGPPISISLIGGLTLIASLVLGIFAITKLGFSFGTAEGLGGLCFTLICIFGVWASFEFLRGRSAKLLMIAIVLGAAMDVIVLIGFPVYQANSDVPIEEITSGRTSDTNATRAADSDDDNLRIVSPQERLEAIGGRPKIMLGVGILVLSFGLLVYLSTGSVSRHFERPRFSPPVSLLL
jgi:hypothetical protein